MLIRALIVDDETLARNRLRNLLVQEPGLEVIGECASGPDAIGFIREQKPDLVFLDVQMPEVSGFEVLRAFKPEILPAIVFVTAHDQHAVRAFEVSALDYLLKPVARERLQEAVRRVRQRLKPLRPARLEGLVALRQLGQESGSYLNRFAVKDQNQTLFVKVEDVDYIESAGNYAVLHTAKGNHVLRDTLSNLETSLPPSLFLRISRSLVVNLERVKAIRAGAQEDWVVVLHDDRQLVMTRGLQHMHERLQYPGSRRKIPAA